ncbi:MAG: DsbA family oxidoreductase [Paenibacillus macerans]|uniref:DSBA-like thioredoxin domain protein n=1 Tax=Paenibacillus macerans TaxID=44252 RepID=A0A090ZY24_PAEMA|nr:DsbA family oxidoreductase [Paenibacillus macerans]KFN09006.1 DSBA-like thioredoxin domain protein [Paenibacillus macerans]MBS5913014.1 DsbA family oxidoreductase [Paenibacillus macerans]MCY7560788.1 DsbA family oxidoreductase [Paenibacillus macerans]MDU7477121.1 DsbA family oxidoreductase [Paenibacillus macerans]MEC0139971.1 DsbA family oxidoreductase [Paenibacillus macerans]
MKIEVWSDFSCPFCYIGKRRLEKALEAFEHREEVQVVYRSFELDPEAPKDAELSIHELLAVKYGLSLLQAKESNQNVAAQAKAEGLDYHFDTAIPTNTFDAHRLSHYAGEKGKAKEMTERLYRAYFTDSLHIGDRDTLVRLAEEAGLDGREAGEVLDQNRYADQVLGDEREARQLGIRGVPFVVLRGKYAVSGAQPLEIFQGALLRAWEDQA